MGSQGLLVLIGLKILVMMTSRQIIVISGAQGLLMLMESKFVIKMTRLQNIKIKRTIFCDLVIFLKKFDPINIRRLWAPEITVVCSEVIMTKPLKPMYQNQEALATHLISFVFSKACFSSWPLLFSPGVF